MLGKYDMLVLASRVGDKLFAYFGSFGHFFSRQSIDQLGFILETRYVLATRISEQAFLTCQLDVGLIVAQEHNAKRRFRWQVSRVVDAAFADGSIVTVVDALVLLSSNINVSFLNRKCI